MGEVYRAGDRRLGRDVAIKVLPAAYSADAGRLRRFEQEARAAGMLNHPGVSLSTTSGPMRARRTSSPSCSKGRLSANACGPVRSPQT